MLVPSYVLQCPRGRYMLAVWFALQSPTPPQYVFWYHNDRMINYDTSRGGITVETEPGPKTQSRLTIRDAHDTDSGNYTCSASNTEPASIYVFVSEGRPRWKFSLFFVSWGKVIMSCLSPHPHSWIYLLMCPVRILGGTTAILKDILHGFPSSVRPRLTPQCIASVTCEKCRTHKQTYVRTRISFHWKFNGRYKNNPGEMLQSLSMKTVYKQVAIFARNKWKSNDCTFKTTLDVCHHETLMRIVTSPLESYCILFQTQTGTQITILET